MLTFKMLKGWNTYTVEYPYYMNTIGTEIFVMTSEVSLRISRGEYFGTGLSALILSFRVS